MASEYTYENLDKMTVPELRRLCVDKLGIPGMTKKRKDIIIKAIIKLQGSSSKPSVAPTAVATAPKQEGPLTELGFSGHSVLDKPYASFGNKMKTTIQVTCGASSGAFPVEGKSVSEVGEFLREVLNVDKLSTGLVNGKEIPGSYILKNGDSLEFMKPAGRKGR